MISKRATLYHLACLIEDKSYAVKWSADGRRVTKCGAVIDSSKRNITRWRAVDATGDVVEDKEF